MDKPRYRHDCTACVFICRYGVYDVYLHPPMDGLPGSLILRCGSEGPEYTSYPLLMLPRIIEEWRAKLPRLPLAK